MTEPQTDLPTQAVPHAGQSDGTNPTSGDSGVLQQGLCAGPRWMLAAGLLAGIVAWIVFDKSYPFLRLSQASGEAAPLAAGPPSPAEIARLGAEQRVLNQKNSMGAGLVLGALAGLIFSVAEALRRPRRWSSLALIGIAVLLAAGLGVLAGYAAQEFLVAWRLDRRLQPMYRTMAMQGIFWGLVAVGVGLGIGLFAKRFQLVLGTAAQAMMSVVLFVLVYVVLAGILFPIDDAERIVPASSGNRALWCIAALTVLGLFLGLARQRQKLQSTGTRQSR